MISMLVITFYLADGYVGETIKLPLSNIELTDPFAACVIFWCVFVWLNFRYWLVFRNAPFDSDSESTLQSDRSWRSAWSAVFVWTPIAHDDALKAISEDGKFQNYNNQVKEEVYKKNKKQIVMHKDNEQWAFWVTDNISTFNNRSDTLNSSLCRKVYLKNLLRAIFKHPYLTAWYAPWMLSISAVAIALSKKLL